MGGSGAYRNPTPTVDVIIETPEGQVILIRRKNPPHGWALPGGFLDAGEMQATAARREALEETGLTVELTELFHCYSDPRRDPRQHTVSTVFLGRSSEAPRAGDDAADVRAFAMTALPEEADLVFDHATILSDYATYRASGRRPPPER
jgi:8-oxo-dGTP diphosphatase